MKRILAFFLAAVLLLMLPGCVGQPKPVETEPSIVTEPETVPPTAPTPDEDAFRFTRESFPVLDGSTSMVPLGQAIASVLLGESREDVADLIQFNRTTESFRRLQRGESDLVIAAEPKSQVFEEMREAAFPYLMETIAKEALVFVVNRDNPVESLTGEQVKKIYTGEITNWNQVGGDDLPIEAFQRNASSGSQVMMEKLVMDGRTMMAAPSTRIPMEMGELINAVRSFDSSANAIGYTVYYYAADMKMADGLKILKIDGVEPTTDTIRSETYPYINGYYCCINAASGKDSPQRRLFDWLVSDAGQTLLTLEGYVSVSLPGTAAKSGSDLYSDFSGYAPNEQPVAKYTDFDCPKDHLEPSDAYGLIYPYSGPAIYASWGDGYDEFPAGRMNGFFNHRGERITDPVYSFINRYHFEGADKTQYFWVISSDSDECRFAAKDGSFVSEQSYQWVTTVGSQILAVRDYGHNLFDVFDQDFKLVKTQDDFTVDSSILYPYEFVNGLYCGVLRNESGEDQGYAVINENGTILAESDVYISILSSGIIAIYQEDWHQTLYDPEMNPFCPGGYTELESFYPFNDNFYYVKPVDEEPFICDKNGTIFEWDFEDYSVTDGSFFTIKHTATANVYNSRGQIIHRDVPSEYEYLGKGSLFSEQAYSLDLDRNVITLRNLAQSKAVDIPGGIYAYVCGDVIAVDRSDDDVWSTEMYDLELNHLGSFPGSIYTISDISTGKELVCASNYSANNQMTVYSADGKTQLLQTTGTVQLEAGCLCVSDDNSFTCTDELRTVLFCYPYSGMQRED